MTISAPENDKAEMDAKALAIDAQIRQFVRDYHFALDLRQHGGGACFRLVNQIEELLDMPYTQGQEQRERAEKKPWKT